MVIAPNHVGPAAGVGEGTWRVLVRSIAEAPPRAKRSLRLLLGAWLGLVALQIFDIWGRPGPKATAELASAVLGSLGAFLLAMVYTLHAASEEATTNAGARDGAAISQVLLPLPLVSFVAGVLLAIALVLMLVRGMLGVAWAFVAVIGTCFALALVGAGATVRWTTALLYRHAHEQARRAAAAQSEAAEARLSALQSQLNPHFLFNALNTVASLVRTDARAAESTVENLAEVLRRTLDRSRDATRSLGDEIDYVQAYLAVEQQRWGKRLRVEWRTPSELLATRVPTMTLQPLVENALKHGLGERLSGGTVCIAAERVGEMLRLTIDDDGAGFAPRFTEGTGLGNLRRRLETIYGDAAQLRVEQRDIGARVLVEVPMTARRGA